MMRVNSFELKQAMAAVSRTSNRRSTLPILGHVCIAPSENGIELATTNLEQMIVVEIETDSTDWQSITVDASLFAKFISELPDKSIDLTQKKGRLYVECGGFKANFPTMDGADFPLIEYPTSDGFEMTAADFASMVNLVAFAASQNIAQPTLQGISLEIIDSHATFVATDGTRLSVLNLDVDAPDCSMIIPSTALTDFLAIAKNQGKITVIPGDGYLWMMTGNIRMKSQLISARYPDYQRIIPKETNQEAEVNAMELRQALRSVQVLAGGNNLINCFWESDALFLEAANQESGEAKAAIAAKADMSRFDFNINGRYLMDIVGRAESSAILRGTTANRPIVFEIDGMKNFLHLIMPMSMEL